MASLIGSHFLSTLVSIIILIKWSHRFSFSYPLQQSHAAIEKFLMRHLNESLKCEFIQATVKKIFDFKSSLIFPQKMLLTKNPVHKFHSPAWVYNLFYGGVGLVNVSRVP